MHAGLAGAAAGPGAGQIRFAHEGRRVYSLLTVHSYITYAAPILGLSYAICSTHHDPGAASATHVPHVRMTHVIILFDAVALLADSRC